MSVINSIKREIIYQFNKRIRYPMVNKIIYPIEFYWYYIRRHYYFPSISRERYVLIIRMDAIGDCTIWLDQAKEYRNLFPNHRLVLLHNLVWKDIADRLPYFDERIAFDRKQIFNHEYCNNILKKVNRHYYEKVISPVFSRDLLYVDWFVHNTCAKEKIGFVGDYDNNSICNILRGNSRNDDQLKKVADKWYTKLIPNSDEPMMELQRNADFLSKLTNLSYKSALPIFPFELKKYDMIPQGDYVVFFLGASNKKRMWAAKKFAQVAKSLESYTIVVCGSNTEQYLYDEFIQNINNKDHIVNLVGKTTLVDLISVIKYARLLLSNETSASHFAVATRTPSVCLLGGGHYGRFHPYKVDVLSIKDSSSLPIVITSRDTSCFGCNWKCNCNIGLPDSKWKCIDDIKEKDVIYAIRSILD